MNYTLENFIDYCNEYQIAEEAFDYADNKQIKFKFFGKEFTLKLTINGEDPDEATMRKIDNVLKIAGTNKSLYSYLYTISEKFIDDINDDPYFDGKRCDSAKDLVDALKFTHVIVDTYKGNTCIYLAGEYWLDDEHGFSITFPDGKFIKAKKGANGYYQTCDSHYRPIATGLGQFSDPF